MNANLLNVRPASVVLEWCEDFYALSVAPKTGAEEVGVVRIDTTDPTTARRWAHRADSNGVVGFVVRERSGKWTPGVYHADGSVRASGKSVGSRAAALSGVLDMANGWF